MIALALGFVAFMRFYRLVDTGDAKAWVNVDKVDYLLPGTNVPFSSNEGKTVSHESGSSVATAAASGLAAVLLSASWVLDENDQHFSDDKNMRVAFKNLTMENKYPQVQERPDKRFKDELAQLEKDGGEQRRQYDF
ncbi:hypothetical protein NM208_g1187 [Fusarium decemcellulare]|uniref:Uncharacterized protein n=1 Tax=Fusarium decemcellulare TaxID=57161 RepID=A0ACC1SWQ7_9HYPO|nr:hypothetical protein NM208_g1187 [Fusarium decemcellulare]